MNKIIPIRADEYHLGEILLLKGSKRLEIDGQKHMVITTFITGPQYHSKALIGKDLINMMNNRFK